MTIKQWLSNVHYDQFGQYFWNKTPEGNQMVAEVRGWGALQNEFPTQDEAAAFQDQVGEFIAAAIREKIAREAVDPEVVGYTISPFGTPEKL
jgi:hypothetical protein